MPPPEYTVTMRSIEEAHAPPEMEGRMLEELDLEPSPRSGRWRSGSGAESPSGLQQARGPDDRMTSPHSSARSSMRRSTMPAPATSLSAPLSPPQVPDAS